MKPKNNLKLFFTTTVAILLLDIITKFAVTKLIKLNSSLLVISDFVMFTHLKNEGAGFGILQQQTILLLTISIIAIGFIIYYIYKYQLEKFELVATSILLGGILGNTLERITFQSVTDFIQVGWFPIFNVADIAITIGASMIIIYTIKKDIAKATKKAEKKKEK